MISFFMTVVALSVLPLLLCEECGEVITQSTHTLTSPNHPRKYPNDLECKWKISVEESSRIHLWFTYFQFEKDGDSSCYDCLRMWDGGDDGAERVFLSCAESLEDFKAENKGTASFNSSGNMFYLRMTTDGGVRRRGFSATFVSIPGPPSTTETVVGSKSPDAQSTHLKGTTADWGSTSQGLIVSTATPFGLFSTSLTANSIETNPVTAVFENISTYVPWTITLANRSTNTRASSSDIPTLEPNENPSSNIPLVVVPTVSLVLLLVCLCVTGLFVHTRRSSGKSNASSNDSSCHDVGTNPVRTVEEQCEPYNKILYYTNESFHASPQGTYPPPYQSINSADDFRTAQMNDRVLSSEEVIGDVAYESFDGEEKRKGDYTANAENVHIVYESYDGEEMADSGGNTANEGEATNIVYESYDGKGIVANGDYEPNTGEAANISYESYDGKEIADNGDYPANVEEISNIAYESYDGQGKVENDDNVFNEGKTLNVVYESYDRQENSPNSDNTENGEILNVAYERYDGEKNVAYDADDFSMTYQTIDDSQSRDDDYYKI